MTGETVTEEDRPIPDDEGPDEQPDEPEVPEPQEQPKTDEVEE